MRIGRPVIDYGSTMVQWLQGGSSLGHGKQVSLGVERPSASYIINVCSRITSECLPSLRQSNRFNLVRCLHQSSTHVLHLNRSQANTCTSQLTKSNTPLTWCNGPLMGVDFLPVQVVGNLHYGTVRLSILKLSCR